MSRQRLRPSMGETSHLVCPRCNGIGSMRSVESLALSILRLMGEDARKERTSRIIVQVPVDVATYLMNEKRDWLRDTEDKTHSNIVLVPNPHIQTPEYSFRRIRDDEVALPEHNQVSYQMPAAPAIADPTLDRDKKPPAEAPAVATFLPPTAAPVVAPPERAPAASPAPASPGSGYGLWARMKRFFVGSGGDSAATRDARPARAGRGDAQRDGRDQRDHRDHRDRSGPRRGGGRGPYGDRGGARRDGPRGEPRREGRPRDEFNREPRRPDAPRAQPPRHDAPRAEARAADPARDWPRAGTPRPGGERSERGGRSRRGGRRRRGGAKREGGDPPPPNPPPGGPGQATANG